MGHILTPQEKSKIRSVLSETFVDNEVSYSYIARKIKGYDLATIKDILYSEVAPACHTNFMTPPPPIWTGFDEEWLNSTIEEILKARDQSWWRRNFDKILVAWLRFRYAYIWKDIMEFCDRLE